MSQNPPKVKSSQSKTNKQNTHKNSQQIQENFNPSNDYINQNYNNYTNMTDQNQNYYYNSTNITNNNQYYNDQIPEKINGQQQQYPYEHYQEPQIQPDNNDNNGHNIYYTGANYNNTDYNYNNYNQYPPNNNNNNYYYNQQDPYAHPQQNFHNQGQNQNQLPQQPQIPTNVQSQKDHLKLSEIKTSILKIQDKITNKTNLKISTKINFTKKMFIYEFQETIQQQLPSSEQNPDQSQQPQNQTIKNNSKFEIKFKDIKKIEIQTQNTYSITIVTGSKPREFKDYNTQARKNSQWIEQSFIEQYFGLQFQEKEQYVIQSIHSRELIREVPGKLSHLEKIKTYGFDNLYIDEQKFAKLTEQEKIVKQQQLYNQQLNRHLQNQNQLPNSQVPPQNQIHNQIQNQNQLINRDGMYNQESSQSFSYQQSNQQSQNADSKAKKPKKKKSKTKLVLNHSGNSIVLTNPNMPNNNLNFNGQQNSQQIGQQQQQLDMSMTTNLNNLTNISINNNSNINNSSSLNNFNNINSEKNSVLSMSNTTTQQKKSKKIKKDQNGVDEIQKELALHQQQENQLQQLIQKQEYDIYPILSKQNIKEAESYLNQHLKSRSQAQKEKEINELISYKKHAKNIYEKTSKCPFYKCQKQFESYKILNKHIKKKHPYLTELGLEQNQNLQFIWNNKALDYVLMLNKIYPNFVQKVIKQMENYVPVIKEPKNTENQQNSVQNTNNINGNNK